jgi:protein-S-isoprenylcysteine O-methyltransferase Ste14
MTITATKGPATSMLPPAWLLIALVAIAVLRLVWPADPLLPGMWPLVGVVAIAAGVALNAAGDRQFHQARTPMHPAARPATFVTDGVFRLSRNPMYLGIVSIVFGVALLVNRWPALLVAPALAWLLQVRFVRHEERRMRETFGPEYARYCQRVRRWI